MSFHILFVAPSAYTLSGLATWLDYLLPGLEDLGWRTTLGLVEGAHAHRVDAYLAVHPCDNAIALTCKTGTPQGRRWAVQKAVRALAPDIVVTVNIPDAVAATAELRSQGKSQTRIVMSCHGIQEDLFADMRSFSNAFDLVVCTNNLACKLAENYAGLEHSQIAYAPCGTSTVPLNPRKLGEVLNLAFVGRLEQPQKRVHDLPTILEHLQSQNIPFHLKIAGQGPEEQDLQKRLEKFIVEGKVEFLGHVPQEKLAQVVYSEVDALIMPSSWETGPIVVWEAMGFGVPVVSSRYVGSGLENALKDAENCLLFNVGDTAAAARQLARLYSQPECWQTIRQNAWSLVKERYSHSVSIQQWSSVFQTLLMMPLKSITMPDIQSIHDRSRLDKWLGAANGERIRQLLGKTSPDTGAGGEWPHSYKTSKQKHNAFLVLAKSQDFSD